MTDCMKLWFIYERDPVWFLIWWTLCFIPGFMIIGFTTHFVYNVCNNPIIKHNNLKIASIIACILYCIAFVRYMFIVSSFSHVYWSSDERLDQLKDDCNTNARGIANASILSQVSGYTYLLTFYIYYLRYKLCFEKTAFYYYGWKKKCFDWCPAMYVFCAINCLCALVTCNVFLFVFCQKVYGVWNYWFYNYTSSFCFRL